VFDGWSRDLRVASRALRRAPVVALAAILSLAIGTGVNVSTFGVFSAALLRSLPYRDASDLYILGHADQAGVGGLRWSFERFQRLRQVNTTFASVTAFSERRFPISTRGHFGRWEGI
jgi:hypothetical protein